MNKSVQKCTILYMHIVNGCAQRGLRFLGFVPQQGGGTLRSCNGGGPCSRGSPSGLSCESGIEDETPPEYGGFNEGGETKLFALFHSWDSAYPAWLARDEDTPSWTYHQGELSMKVTRKGQAISMLEADWLELTTAYYKKGWSLVDSFVYWETPKGEPVPRSLEGLFLYEERGASTAPPAGNDTIIVEQWTVIEGSDVKTDYGPLVHTLAEFGWLLTCVLPTPLIRHDRSVPLAPHAVRMSACTRRAYIKDSFTEEGEPGSSPYTAVPSCLQPCWGSGLVQTDLDLEGLVLFEEPLWDILDTSNLRHQTFTLKIPLYLLPSPSCEVSRGASLLILPM
ncbi:Raftlin-2 [Acipenser ruthenus]|uniref:Raftlin-2 n=1 Tax=Acipenser ruthenus TaxID=7906 RepID=A0A444UCL9_ACIRT|nr:Raftlin-2 [Acipenser ruthenus]